MNHTSRRTRLRPSMLWARRSFGSVLTYHFTHRAYALDGAGTKDTTRLAVVHLPEASQPQDGSRFAQVQVEIWAPAEIVWNVVPQVATRSPLNQDAENVTGSTGTRDARPSSQAIGEAP